MRSAAIVSACPEPRVVGGQQRHAALALAIEHKQGLVFGALHHDAAALVRDIDLTIPLAPRRLVGLAADDAASECAVFGMDEADVAYALRQPWTSINNDSSGASTEGLLGSFHPHPRAFGTFPRVLRKYVREEHLLSLEDAVRKFSALPAARLRLNDRGLVKTGLWADLVVFDPASITDLATFASPNQLSKGMDWVLVNGEPVIADGKMTGAKPGRVLRGPGYRSSLKH